MWWFLMELVVWFPWSETLFFCGPIGFTYIFSCAIVGWTFPVIDMSIFWASGIIYFGCMSKDLMVLVPLEKTLTLYSSRVHLYWSLRPLVYSMTTLVPSMNFPVMGLLSVGVCLAERTLLGSGCFVGLCEGDPFVQLNEWGCGLQIICWDGMVRIAV